jgi:hypothetical protein
MNAPWGKGDTRGGHGDNNERGKGTSPWRWNDGMTGICYSYALGQECMSDPCPYAHKCPLKTCGQAHKACDHHWTELQALQSKKGGGKGALPPY